jgi:hypothetical protein
MRNSSGVLPGYAVAADRKGVAALGTDVDPEDVHNPVGFARALDRLRSGRSYGRLNAAVRHG